MSTSSHQAPEGPVVPPRAGGDRPDATGRRHVVLPTTIGDLQVVATATAVVGVYHADHDPAPSSAVLGQALARDDAAQVAGAEADCGTGSEAGARAKMLSAACRELLEYLDGRRRSFEVPTDAQGTTFQRRVWSAIEQVPYGERCSYRDIATALGNPGMGRAVGAAIRANPLSIVIPGHRVVGRTGAVTGYAAGTGVKSWLLELEACRTSLDAESVESGGMHAPAEQGPCQASSYEEVVESKGVNPGPDSSPE